MSTAIRSVWMPGVVRDARVADREPILVGPGLLPVPLGDGAPPGLDVVVRIVPIPDREGDPRVPPDVAVLLPFRLGVHRQPIAFDVEPHHGGLGAPVRQQDHEGSEVGRLGHPSESLVHARHLCRDLRRARAAITRAER